MLAAACTAIVIGLGGFGLWQSRKDAGGTQKTQTAQENTDSAEALVAGDVLHLGELQAADPDIGLVYDLDPAVGARTRRLALEAAASENWLVAGGHIGFSRIEKSGTGYRLRPA